MKKCLAIILALAVSLCATISASAESTTTAFGDWELAQYVDDFGDPTGNSYYRTISTGTFSNTATSGSELTVVVFFNQSYGSFAIRLLEYNNARATYYQDTASIKFKIGDTVYSHTIWIGDSTSDDLPISDLYENRVKAESLKNHWYAGAGANALKATRSFEDSAYQQLNYYLAAGTDVRCVIEIGNSKYSFSISSNGFGDAVYGEAYEDAVVLMENGDYANAYEAFNNLRDYKDSSEKAYACLSAAYGPLVVEIGTLQKEQDLTLTEALTIVEEEGTYKESEQSVALMERLRKVCECEGSYSLCQDSQYGPYELQVRYIVNGAALEAEISYPGFSSNKWKGNGSVVLLDIDDDPYTVRIDVVGISTSTYAEMACIIWLNEQNAVFNCVTGDWTHEGTR